MNMGVNRYHYTIRMAGVLSIVLLIGFSDYHENIFLLSGVIVFYVGIMTLARFKIWFFKKDCFVTYNLYLDVTILSVAIAVRGGLRSDFYLGFFLILGYVLIISNKNLLLRLSGWIVVNYSFFTFLVHEGSPYDYGRLIIRLALIIGTALLLERYSKLLGDTETLRQKAVNLAMYDPLTGSYNRRILDYVTKLYGPDAVLNVVVIDLDNFKRINDTYGHPQGDEVLIGLTQDIQRVIEDKNICIRYGGEEFLLIVDAVDFAHVIKILKKIQHSFMNRGYPWFQEDKGITFTAGVSVKRDDEDMDGTISRADQCLYYGKDQGKNCIVLEGFRVVG